MAVSEQCLRESQALHPDYYRTNKKTLLRLNEACTRAQNRAFAEHVQHAALVTDRSIVARAKRCAQKQATHENPHQIRTCCMSMKALMTHVDAVHAHARSSKSRAICAALQKCSM
jgi:hypothetical protein